jgi:hypothetical protein
MRGTVAAVITRNGRIVALGHARLARGAATLNLSEFSVRTRGTWQTTLVLSRPRRVGYDPDDDRQGEITQPGFSAGVSAFGRRRPAPAWSGAGPGPCVASHLGQDPLEPRLGLAVDVGHQRPHRGVDGADLGVHLMGHGPVARVALTP